MAGSIALGARRLTGSQDQVVAAERAAEAAESVFKARDNRTLTWAQIRNVVGSGGDNGIFIDGPRDIREAGVEADYLALDEPARVAVLTAELGNPRQLVTHHADYSAVTRSELAVLDEALA